MKHTTNKSTVAEFGGMISFDTTFVLFFLAMEYGRSTQMFSIDAVLMGITTLMVLALPYFLPSPYEKPTYMNWLAGRGAIAVFGMLVGLAFRQSVGVVLPESLRYMPMTFLVVTAMISCYIQFYSLMKLRLAK
jgi:branched-subunit amino acid transport protein AzlD